MKQKTIRVNVTQNDIKYARQNHGMCPVTLALKRRLKKRAYVGVTLANMHFSLTDRNDILRKSTYIVTPNVIGAFLKTLDEGAVVHPIRVSLKVPQVFLK